MQLKSVSSSLRARISGSVVFITACFLAVLLPAPATAFEGSITMVMKEGRNEMPMTYHIKGTKVRVEVSPSPGMQAVSLFDTEAGRMVILMPQQNMFMTMDFATEFDDETEELGTIPNITDTGETETILGYLARKFIIQEGRDTVEVWLAEGLGSFMGMGSNEPNRARQSGWETMLMGREMFPLRMVTRNRRNQITSSFEVTKVEERTLSDSLFEIPAGMQEFSLGGLLRQGLGR